MGKIIAIGGGNKHRTKYSVEALAVDKEMVKLSGIKAPKLLIIPTASSDLLEYAEDLKSHFESLGCIVNVLNLLKNKICMEQIETKILNSDIIYVGGGNTLKMMKIWRKLNVDIILKKAFDRNIVLAGVSAGAICWFKYGNSDSRRDKNPDANLIKVRGINLHPFLLCPHYDVDVDRKEDLKKMMKNMSEIAIGLDNCCAIEIIGDKYRIVKSKLKAKAYRAYWKAGKYHEEEIIAKKKFQTISELSIK